MTQSSLTISIVIPVHNGGRDFYKCLESIQKSIHFPDEIIVVCDGTTGDSLQIAEQFKQVKTLQLQTQGGPARARNQGANIATGDILFFVDADVTVHPNTIKLVLEKFQQNPGLSALIGSYDDAPGASNFLSQYKNLFHHYTHQSSSEKASTFWGACGAVRRPIFQEINGFDEQYKKPCIEDIELGYRLRRNGHSIYLCKDIQVKHLKCWRLINLLKAEIFYRALPWTTLILRTRTLNSDLNLNQTNRFSVIFVFCLICSLIMGVLVSPFWLVATSIIVLGLLTINWKVYRFFYYKRGFFFALRVIPWHWLYFFYGGAAFAWGSLIHYTKPIFSCGKHMSE